MPSALHTGEDVPLCVGAFRGPGSLCSGASLTVASGKLMAQSTGHTLTSITLNTLLCKAVLSGSQAYWQGQFCWIIHNSFHACLSYLCSLYYSIDCRVGRFPTLKRSSFDCFLAVVTQSLIYWGFVTYLSGGYPRLPLRPALKPTWICRLCKDSHLDSSRKLKVGCQSHGRFWWGNQHNFFMYGRAQIKRQTIIG